MSTIAANDRKTAQYIALAGQTDFGVDFAPMKDGQAFLGVYAEVIRGAAKLTLTLDDFQVTAPQLDPNLGPVGFTARLNTPALAGDKITFYGRTPTYRPREHRAGAGFSSVVAEDDMAWMVATLQEHGRDLSTLLNKADLEFGEGGSSGVQTWGDLQGRPPNLLALAGLAGAADKAPYFTGAGAMELTDMTAFGRSILGATAAVAMALTSPLAAKGDIFVYSNANTRLPVGPNGYVLVADSASALGVKWAAAASGGGVPDWNDLINIPAKVSAFAGVAGGANKVAYFTGADAQGVTSLTAFGRSLIGAADAAAVNALLGGGGGGGGGGPFPTMASYGAAQNNATDDKAAFDAFIADGSHARAWLEGVSYHSGLQRDISKPAKGPGRIRVAAGDWAPAEFAWLTAKPAVGTGYGTNYYYSGDISKIEASYYVLGRLTAGGNIRRGLTEPYFESVTTPRFETLTNYSGWSGMSAHLNGAIGAGATIATLNSAAGFVTGDVIGFLDANNNVLESRTVTVAGNQISWAGGLTNAYPDKRSITHGMRTHNAYRYTEVNHFGGGDAYAHVARAVVGYTPIAGQVHFFETSTVGLFGGDIAFNSSGVYATSEEYQASDNGNDVAYIGYVSSFDRSNDTGALSVVWMGSYMQSYGSKPIDAFFAVAGKSRVGFDFARADFTSNGNAAIQMALGHKIFFNASVTPGGRGYGQSAYGYGGLFGNTSGDMVLESGNDGTSDFIALRFLRAAGNDARLRIRPNGIQSNVSVTISGSVLATGDMTAGSSGVIGFGVGTGAYFYSDGVNVYWHNSVASRRIALVGVDV